jgi:aminoglycoside 2'-N-acetyltransferase I
VIVVRCEGTSSLSRAELERLRQLADLAFDGNFGDDDWQHALGGHHVVAVDEGEIVAHAAVVARRITIGARAWGAGYVEAVATHPARQGAGLGTSVMAAVADVVAQHHALGVLSTGEHGFYERLGWERWQGPSFVLEPDGGRRRTADEDDGIMVLRTAASVDVALTDPITCEARPGDDW